jgi:hypothetical protein
MNVEELINNLTNKKDRLKKHIELYESSPVKTRNDLSEQGMEVTPYELKVLIDLLKTLSE